MRFAFRRFAFRSAPPVISRLAVGDPRSLGSEQRFAKLLGPPGRGRAARSNPITEEISMNVMPTVLQRSLLLFATYLFLLVVGFAGNAAAVVPVAPLDKEIVIVNNSSDKRVFFPVLQKGATIGNPDLWMQAAFVQLQERNFPIFKQKNPYPEFPTTLVYRAYIDIANTDKTTGLQPGQSVTITVPFWTQLQEVTDNNIGVNTDQFIDWWNAARIYLFEGALFEGATALHAAQITDGSTVDKKPHTPTPVAPVGGAKVPTCVASGGATCTVTLLSYTIDPPFGIPFQLQEYTFASAVGPPLDRRPATFKRDENAEDGLLFVNYNVSSLDSVYLPVAMGPLTKSGNSDVPYVGSTQSVANFRNELATFGGDNGTNWPIYVPVYFDELSNHPGLPNEPIFNAACSLDAFENPGNPNAHPPVPNELPKIPRYELPKVPGTFNMLVESYRDPPPIPPVLTSDPPVFPSTWKCNPSPPPPFVDPPKLGTVGKGVVDLWMDCIYESHMPRSTPFASPTCRQLRDQFRFFQKNYMDACKMMPDPDFTSTIQAIYGFVPINFGGCKGGALNETAGFKKAILDYCDLQYNYLTVIRKEEIFNPFTQLIHDTLKSSAYAFSIDDKVSFKHVEGTGIILAIAGANGLENRNASQLPDRNNFKEQCQEKPPKAEVRAGLTPFTLELEQPPVSVP
jgi:hypothetical protein